MRTWENDCGLLQKKEEFRLARDLEGLKPGVGLQEKDEWKMKGFVAKTDRTEVYHLKAD